MSLIHAPLTAAFRARPLIVYAFMTDHGEALTPLFLKYTAEDTEYKARMLPVDGYRGRESYSLYAVTVPAAHMKGEALCYSFFYQGREGETYRVPLAEVPAEEKEAHAETDNVPALLPLEIPEKHYLASGDLVLRFVVLGTEKCTPTVSVFTQHGEEIFSCEANTMGELEARIPFSLLSRTGAKLRFALSAAGPCCVATLGNEKSPLTVHLIDNAGPALTAVRPKDGEVLPKGSAPCLEVSYFDISGINLNNSVFCLDGSNLSQDAEWGETRMTYTPPKALRVGKHVMELTLRDKKGNHTYYRVKFFVGENAQKEEESGDKRKNAKPWHTAAFAAKVFSAFRGLFSDKK